MKKKKEKRKKKEKEKKKKKKKKKEKKNEKKKWDYIAVHPLDGSSLVVSKHYIFNCLLKRDMNCNY